jgi:Protein of unknown function (DUF1553)/Protein of unknown function (DUF1549)
MATAFQPDVFGRSGRVATTCAAAAWVTVLVVGTSAFKLQAAQPRAQKQPIDLAAYDAVIKAEDRAHWAFQPIKRPPVPEVQNTTWVRNPIDAFVRAKLEEQGISPAPQAEAQALLRRLYLDVTGLPPTPEERAAFLRAFERAPDAVERLVDDLLARPARGERWARRWLDLVRYADSNGYERDADKPFVWRYRDYVIRSFNCDKPFDRFILEQLAGDELPAGEANPQTLVATGYYRLGPWDDEPADPKQDRYDQIDDIVSTTSEVFLGLTLGCARCHNHKFEPLTMHDYYRMVAIFEPLERPVQGRTEIALPIGTPAKDLRKRPFDEPRGYFLKEPSPTPRVSRLLFRGQASSPGHAVGPGVPAVTVGSQPRFPAPSTGDLTSRRRLTLARWLTDSRNPLTARVIVNRVWQSHFGVGLVRTPSDFGTMGEPPTHPELLDWLARWFVERGWSVKSLDRLILTSRTYQLSTQTVARNAELDPENRLWWRRPYRRLDVEVIRDAMLAASGELNREMYGPSMYPSIPAAALSGHSDPTKIWKPSAEASAARRTIYAFVKRSLLVPMLEVLDFCDTARSAPSRNVTSVPTQALTLLNGDFVNRQARRLAFRLEQEAGADRSAQIERAYLLAFARMPRDTERAALAGFLEQEYQERLRESQSRSPLATVVARQKALVQVCRALFNTNEFVYAD